MAKLEKKQFRGKKPNYSPKPWPDLPQKICNLISKQPNLLNRINSKGQTKSWVKKSTKCNSSNFSSISWLQLFDLPKGTDGIEVSSFSIKVEPPIHFPWKFTKLYQPASAWACRALHCVGWSQGFLVAKSTPAYNDINQFEGNCDIWYPSHPGYWEPMHLPWHKAECSGIFLSSDVNPNKNECIAMSITGNTSPAFGFYRIGPRHFDTRKYWEKWMNTDCGNIVDPHCSNPYEREHYMRITNAIGFRGKFYAVSLQGTLVVIEDKDGVIGITGLCKQRVVPSVSSKHYRECLVESDGRVLLVFLISRNSVRIVDNVEVYIVGDDDLKLRKCGNIGDAALFLGENCCMAISGKRVGCKGNSIYFTTFCVDDWWVYDLKTDTISSTAWNVYSQLD